MYSYIDPCTKDFKYISGDMSSPIMIAYYGQVKAFKYEELYNGTFDAWINSIYNKYKTTSPCQGAVTTTTTTTSTTLATNIVNSVMNLNSIASIASMGTSLNVGSTTDRGSNTSENEQTESNTNSTTDADLSTGSPNDNTNPKSPGSGTKPSQGNTTGSGNNNSTGSSSNPDNGNGSGQGTGNTGETGGNTSENQGGSESGGGVSNDGNGSGSGSNSNSNNNGNGSGSGTKKKSTEEETGTVPAEEEAAAEENAAVGQNSNKTTAKAKTKVQKPAILVTGDIVGVQTRADGSQDARGTMSLTRVKGDGTASIGFSADYMVNAQIGNINIMRSWIGVNEKGNKHINVLSNSFTILPKSLSNTLLFVRVNSLEKFTAIYGGAGTYGRLFEEEFISTLAIAGFMYKGELLKNLDATIIAAGVWAPYTKYYTESFLESQPIIIPFLNLNYKLTKTFGIGLTGGGTYISGQDVVNYQVLCGAKLLL